jgi:hypothetical protein
MNNNGNLPSYEELFGSPDFKKGNDARSVYSPAAYLTDLLQMIQDSFQSITSDEEAASAVNKLSLGQRRGDIKDILLNAENTFEQLPYLDIVNDLLQRRIEAGNEKLDAFEVLKTASYPFNLPLNYDYERVKKFLGYLNITSEELYVHFLIDCEHENY